MRFLPLLLAVFSLLGCTPDTGVLRSPLTPPVQGSDLEDWQMMLGKWYGRMPTEEGGEHEWLIERHADGTYEIQFREHLPDGSVNTSVEVGIWGISGDVYFSIYRGNVDGENIYPADSNDPRNYDGYHILRLTVDEFEYVHARTGEHYQVKKVPDSFSLIFKAASCRGSSLRVISQFS